MSKVIQGGRALAAALAGAPVYVQTEIGWQKTANSECSAARWRKQYSANDSRADEYGVLAADARRLGLR